MAEEKKEGERKEPEKKRGLRDVYRKKDGEGEQAPLLAGTEGE